MADKSKATPAPAENGPKELTETQVRAKLRSQAEQELINKHRPEFNQIAERLFKAAGLEFRRKLTPTERAAERIRKELEAHPELRAQFPGTGPQAEALAAPDGTVVG